MTGRGRISIVVLIDALGWTYVEQSGFLAEVLPHRRPLRTVLGYSSGAIPTMLTGKMPAEHGHWNLLYRDPDGSPFRWLRHAGALPDRLLDNRLTRKLLKECGRRLLGLGPLFECCVHPRLLPWFSWVETRNLYAPGGIAGSETIFDVLSRSGVQHRVYSYHQDPDRQLLDRAERDLTESDATFFFLYLCEVDALLHAHCQDPDRWRPRLQWYERRLIGLLAAARRRDPEATMTVLSDHGMMPVRHQYDLVPEIAALGFDMPRDYLAVYDSTMARFWFFSQVAREKIVRHLDALPCGRILADQELAGLGVLFPDRRYGEVIALLDPGWIWASSDFNGEAWSPAGMHGYHPDDSYSDAICLSNQAPPVPMRTIADPHACMLHAAGLRGPGAEAQIR